MHRLRSACTKLEKHPAGCRRTKNKCVERHLAHELQRDGGLVAGSYLPSVVLGRTLQHAARQFQKPPTQQLLGIGESDQVVRQLVDQLLQCRHELVTYLLLQKPFDVRSRLCSIDGQYSELGRLDFPGHFQVNPAFNLPFLPYRPPSRHPFSSAPRLRPMIDEPGPLGHTQG